MTDWSNNRLLWLMVEQSTGTIGAQGEGQSHQVGEEGDLRRQEAQDPGAEDKNDRRPPPSHLSTPSLIRSRR